MLCFSFGDEMPVEENEDNEIIFLAIRSFVIPG